MATEVPTPVAWSKAAVNRGAERPLTSPVKRLTIVAMPTGSPVWMASAGGSRVAGTNDSTLNAPVARICARLLGMAVLFLPGSEDPSEWVPALTAALPGTPVYTVEDAFAPEEVEVAIVAPSGGETLWTLPRLRLVRAVWVGGGKGGAVAARGGGGGVGGG